jgi:hypothetical protein
VLREAGAENGDNCFFFFFFIPPDFLSRELIRAKVRYGKNETATRGVMGWTISSHLAKAPSSLINSAASEKAYRTRGDSGLALIDCMR